MNKVFIAYHPRRDTWDDHRHKLKEELEAYLVDERKYACSFVGRRITPLGESHEQWTHKHIFRGEGVLEIEYDKEGDASGKIRTHVGYGEELPSDVLNRVKSIYRNNRFLIRDDEEALAPVPEWEGE